MTSWLRAVWGRICPLAIGRSLPKTELEKRIGAIDALPLAEPAVTVHRHRNRLGLLLEHMRVWKSS